MKKIKKMLVMLLLTVMTVNTVVPSQMGIVKAAKKKSVSIKITKKKVILQKGKKVTLKTQIKGISKKKCTIVWVSSNKKVAKVSSKGVVKGVKKGNAVITAKIKGTKKKAICKVTVKEKNTSAQNTLGKMVPAKNFLATQQNAVKVDVANTNTEKTDVTKSDTQKTNVTNLRRDSMKYRLAYCPLYGDFKSEAELQVRIQLKGSDEYVYLTRQNPVYKVNGKLIAEWSEETEPCKLYQTVAVAEDVVGEFHVIVYDKKKIEKKHSNRLSSERVYVQIYVGKKFQKSYDIPNTSGNMWDVCEFDSDTQVWDDVCQTKYIPNEDMIWFDDQYDGMTIKGFNYNTSVSEAHIYGNTIDIETTQSNYTDCIPYIDPILGKAGITAKVEKNSNGRYCINLYNQGKCCRTYNLNFAEYKGQFGLSGFRINGVIEKYMIKDGCYCLTAKVGNQLLDDKYIEPILTQKDSTYKIHDGEYILENGEATRCLVVYGADGEYRTYTLAVFHSPLEEEQPDVGDDYDDEYDEIDDEYDDDYDEIDDDYDDEYDEIDDEYDDEYDEIDDEYDDEYDETDDEYDDNYDDSDNVDIDDELYNWYGEFPNYRIITDNGDARIDKLQRSDGKAIKYEIVKYFKDYFEIYITSVEDSVADVCKNLVLTCANIEKCSLWKGTNNEDWEFSLKKPGSMHLVTCKIYYAKMGTGVEPEEMYRMSRDITDDGPMRIVKMRRKDGKTLNYKIVQTSEETCDLYISSVDASFETVYEQLLMVRANADECGVCPGEGNDDWSYVLIDNTTEKDMVYRIYYTPIAK